MRGAPRAGSPVNAHGAQKTPAKTLGVSIHDGRLWELEEHKRKRFASHRQHWLMHKSEEPVRLSMECNCFSRQRGQTRLHVIVLGFQGLHEPCQAHVGRREHASMTLVHLSE